MRICKLFGLLFLSTLSVGAVAVGGWEAGWSPDGSRIAFTSSSPHGISNVWMMNADGSDKRQLTTLGGRAPRWIPGSNKVTFVALRADNPQIYTLDPNTPETDAPSSAMLSLSKHEGSKDGQQAEDAVWSPDGARVAYTIPSANGRARDLWVASSDGSNARGLTTNFWVREYAWSPDGKQLAVIIGRAIGANLWMIDPETREMKQFYQGFCSSPAYSPDGKYIAFALPANKEDHKLYCVEVATMKRKIVPVKSFDGKTIRWSPDSKRMVFGSDDKGDVAVWVAGIENRELRRLTPQGMQAFDPSFSVDGRTILFSGSTETSHGIELYTCASDANIPIGVVAAKEQNLPRYTRLTDSRPAAYSPIWSPDGKKLLVAVVDRGLGALYITDERGSKKQITDFDPMSPMRLSWSPNSGMIAFAQGTNIKIITASSRKPVATLKIKGETTLNWSPDSKSLYFTEWKDAKAGVSVFDLSGETRQITTGSMRAVEKTPDAIDNSPTAPTDIHSPLGVTGPIPLEKKAVRTEVPVNDLYPTCSPDGKRIAFVRDNQLWVMTSDGKDEQQRTNLTAPESEQVAVYDPAWSPDGKSIAFQASRMIDGQPHWEIWTVDSESKGARKIISENHPSEYTNFLRNLSTAPVFTPDGSGIVYTSVADGIAAVARIPVAGGDKQVLAASPSSYHSLSPSGKLAYVSLADGEERVIIRDLAGGKQKELKL